MTTAAPARNPWDEDLVVSRALGVLRLDPADVDAARVIEAAGFAVDLVDEWLDLTEPYATVDDIPRGVVAVAVAMCVEDYRRKDAPFGLTDSWSSDGTFLRLSPDVYKSSRSTLAKYKDRRGLA